MAKNRPALRRPAIRLGPPSWAMAVWLLACVAFAPEAWARDGVKYQHKPPRAFHTGENAVITGEVSQASAVAWATLLYRCEPGPFKWTELNRVGGNTFESVIPANELKGAFLEYYVEAQDDFGETLRLLGSEKDPVHVPVVASDMDLPPEPASSSSTKPDPTAATAVAPPEAPPTPLPPVSDETASIASLRSQPISEAAAPVMVVTAEQMRQLGIRRLVDLMKVLPGFDTSRDVQGFWRVAATGRRSDPELLVLWDGQRMNNPYDGKVPWEIPLDDVERVEVLRGPGGTTYGAGAVSSVVNLVTRREPGVSARATFGSFGQVGGALRFGATKGALRILASGDVSTRSGYERTIERDGLSTNPDVVAGVTDDLRNSFGGRLRFEYALDENQKLFAGVRLFRERRGALVGFIDVVGSGSDLAWTQLLADAGYEATLSGWRIKARLYADFNGTDRAFVLFPVGYKRAGVTYESGIQQRVQADALGLGLEGGVGRTLFEGNELSFGVQVERQKLSPFQYLANVNGEQPTSTGDLAEPAGIVFPQKDPNVNGRLLAGLWLQDEWRLHPRLIATAGLRLDHASFGTVTDASGAALDQSAFVLNPRIALVVRPMDTLSLRLSFARGYRPPTFEEFLSIVAIPPALNNGGIVAGWNPDAPLRPVRVTNVAASAEATTAIEGGRATLRVNGAWNQYDDPIEPVDATGSPRLQNRTRGVSVWMLEAEGRYDVSNRAGTFVNVGWQRARDLQTYETTPDFSLLTDVPQLRANWGLTLPLPTVGSLTLLAQFGSERRNNARTQLEATRRFRIPAYGLISATFRSRPIFDRLELVGSVVNLTDLDYRDDVPRPDSSRMPGLLPREGVNGTVSLEARF